MSYAALEQKLAAGHCLFLDGGTASELQRRGAPMHELIGATMANVTNPDIVRRVHEDYIRAGCDVITANTYGCARNLLGPLGFGDEVASLTVSAVDATLQARARVLRDNPPLVAGSLSHVVPTIEGSDVPDPARRPSFDELQLSFHESADLLARAGCDLLLLEGMSDRGMAGLAVGAAMQTGLPVWVGVTAVESPAGEIVCDPQSDVPLEDMVGDIAEMGVNACGIVHTAMDLVAPAMDVLQQYWSGPVFVAPRSGRPRHSQWEFDQRLTPQGFVRRCREWRRDGAMIFGGCCGVSVPHIQAMVSALR